MYEDQQPVSKSGKDAVKAWAPDPCLNIRSKQSIVRAFCALVEDGGFCPAGLQGDGLLSKAEQGPLRLAEQLQGVHNELFQCHHCSCKTALYLGLAKAAGVQMQERLFAAQHFASKH